jgi:hypothetical protein
LLSVPTFPHKNHRGRNMEGEDEIILTGAYKDFRKELRYGLGSADEKEVSHVLGAICDTVEPHAYFFSGIDVAGIKAYAKPEGTGLAAVVGFLKSHPQAGIKESLRKYCPVPELLPAAESCLFNYLMAEAKVSFRMGDSIAKPATQPSSEPAGDTIAFVGKYKGWISIKKLGIEKVEDWEVSALLCAINNTSVAKAFDFSGVERNDALVSKATGGMRKSYGNLLSALEFIAPDLKGERLADGYVICKVFEAVGYKPYASPEMLTGAHPEVKPPKVRGRKPKA